MYKIALIQNQSEMIRYNYADARPLLNFENYSYDLYTGENIEELADNLRRGAYDSVIIGSNALNDQKIRESLISQKQSFETYLKGSYGLLILHQMRMSTVNSYGFLPEQFDISGIDRKKENPKERAVQGELSIDPSYVDHVILTYPDKVSMTSVQDRCLSVPGIEGLYWHYVKSLDDTVWLSLIKDSSYSEKRNLLLVSRADLTPRIVVTSLTLDWHRQTDLFENIVRYITEGLHNTIIIIKKGQPSFPFKYFMANLKVAKLPHSVISSESLRFNKLPLNVYRTIVLDPAWTEEEIQRSDLEHLTEFIGKGGKLIHFGRGYLKRMSMTCMGGESDFENVKKNAMVWIASKFKDKLWDGSFWCTVDVLQILSELGEPVDQYRQDVLEYVKLHDIDGSYDEVFGATSALLWTYYLFLGSESQEFKKSLEWLKKKIKLCDLYEKAFAYEILLKVGVPVNKPTIRSFRDQVMKQVPNLSELVAFRYAKTLSSYGRVQEAESIAKRLKILQQDGRWIDVSTTSEIASLLIQLRKKMSKPTDEIDDMIFKGIIYIREQLSDTDNYWGGKASETIKAIAAWQDFELLVSGFPTEEVSSLIRSSSEIQGSLTALDSAINLIKSLRNEIAENRLSLDAKNKREGKLKKLSLASLVISVMSVTFLLLFLGYIADKGLFNDAVKTIYNWFGLRGLIMATATSIFLLLLFVLEKYELLPEKLRLAVKKLVSLILGS